MATKSRKPFFERLKSGLEECIAHAQGKLTLKTTTVPKAGPGDLFSMDPDEVTWVTEKIAITNFFSAHSKHVLAEPSIRQ